MWTSAARACLSALILGALFFSAPASAQTIDPVFGRIDAATLSQMQAGLTRANARLPAWSGAHSPGRLVASRPTLPEEITAEELEAARQFILAGQGQNLERAFATLRAGRVRLGAIENALDWITLALIEAQITQAERDLTGSELSRVQRSRQELEAFVRGKRGSMSGLRRLAAMMAPRWSDFEKVDELQAARSTRFVSPARIEVELPAGGR